MKECRSGVENIAERRMWVDNVKELNTEFDEISPCITADRSELIFSSNRLGNIDIYIASRQKRKWKDITAIEELNTEMMM